MRASIFCEYVILKAARVKSTAVQAARHTTSLTDDVAVRYNNMLLASPCRRLMSARGCLRSVCNKLAEPIDETTTARSTAMHVPASSFCECVGLKPCLLNAQLYKQRATQHYLPTMSRRVFHKSFTRFVMPSTAGCVHFFQSVCDRLAKPIDETTTATATTLHMIVSIICGCVMSRLLEAQLYKQRATRLHLSTMSPCVSNKGFICCGMPSTSGCVLLSSVGV
jgi:hypothetical protein